MPNGSFFPAGGEYQHLLILQPRKNDEISLYNQITAATVVHSFMKEPVNMKRCPWAQSELSIVYHDEEWGVPSHDDRHLFELLILEGAQAGLSWETILRKRQNYRTAFADFDPTIIAGFGQNEMQALLSNEGIIRNRLKLTSAVRNAQALLDVRAEFGSFDTYIWQFVDGKPLKNAWRELSQLPAQTERSRAMSKDLRKRGFNFVGPTICYAFMQAVGMVNDHLVDCFRYDKVS
jgi:DNA-3-methyladenine glycosylase I